jgi:hypothetical protein
MGEGLAGANGTSATPTIKFKPKTKKREQNK